MWYTACMGIGVKCNCGWQLQLSEFYAGKRIRCPECERVLDVPGESVQPLYNSRLPERAAPPAGVGRWVPVHCSGGGCGSASGGSCGGGLTFLVMVVVLMSAIGLVNRCSADSAKPQARPGEEEKQRDIKPAGREDEF
jgi:hypothetical protein